MSEAIVGNEYQAILKEVSEIAEDKVQREVAGKMAEDYEYMCSVFSLITYLAIHSKNFRYQLIKSIQENE